MSAELSVSPFTDHAFATADVIMDEGKSGRNAATSGNGICITMDGAKRTALGMPRLPTKDDSIMV
jgi:hypothetical protein